MALNTFDTTNHPLLPLVCPVWKTELPKTVPQALGWMMILQVPSEEDILILWQGIRGTLNISSGLQFYLRLVWIQLCHFWNLASHAPCFLVTKLENEGKRKASLGNIYRLLHIQHVQTLEREKYRNIMYFYSLIHSSDNFYTSVMSGDEASG